MTTRNDRPATSFPVFTPPIYHSVLYHKVRCPKVQEPQQRYVLALKNPFLYGISVADYDKDHIGLGWPGISEYQASYAAISRPTLPDPSNSCRKCPVPLPAREKSACPGTSQTCRMPQKCSLFELHEETPLPFLDKRIRGCHYRVDQPLGFMTTEEKTKTRMGFLGPEKMTWSTEYGDVYLPNYRYKEFIDRPMADITRELETNRIVCRAPKADTKHYDFYHQVRMRRPKAVNPETTFISCAVIPMPRDLPT